MSELHVRQVSAFDDDDGIQVRASDDGDGLTLAGYIARFGQRTEIDDWLGSYTEEIKRGAFSRTIVERGPAKIKMQFNHGHDPAFGTLPIGVWTDLRETPKGLWGEGRIHDTWHTIPIRAALESGALDGMSFKFKVVGETWRKAAKAGETDHRTLTEVALFEAGVVVHPAYEGTSVKLRSRAMDLWRTELDHPRPAQTDDAGNVDGREAVAPVGDTDPNRAEAGPPVGITRRELRRMALSALGVIPNGDSLGESA